MLKIRAKLLRINEILGKLLSKPLNYFSKSGSNGSLKRDLALVIISGLIGSLGSYGVSNALAHEQQKSEEKNVAQALYIDISDISDHFNSTLEKANSSENGAANSDKNQTSITYDPRPYYSNNGLYFVYLTEIYKFDSDLSADLYDYYKTVMDIEYKRQYISDHISKNYNYDSLSENEKNYVVIYSDNMPNEMKICIKQGEVIKTKLKEKYNLNLKLSTCYIKTKSIATP
jgi:hypothetical protein